MKRIFLYVTSKPKLFRVTHILLRVANVKTIYLNNREENV